MGALLLSSLLSSVATAQPYQEAPALAEQVAAGELPTVEQRLPETPLVVPVVERIGEYGGDWQAALIEGLDNGWLIRTIAYEHLVRWNPEWTDVIPNVAESWEISDDATVYTFRLSQGMKWSDGEPFTADDITFWYNDVFMNEALTPSRGDNPPVVEKVDDYTVTFTFAEPNGLFLQNVAHPYNGWMYTAYPRHYLEPFHITYNKEAEALATEAGFATWAEFFASKAGYDARFENSELPTLHPWVLTSGIGDQTVRLVAERNPYYWKVDAEGNQLPYLDRVVYTYVGDNEVAVLKALNGEIDMQDRRLTDLNNKAVFFDNMEAGDYRFFNTVPANMNDMVIAFNLNHKDPVKQEVFQNKDFRVGLSHAINRQEIIDLIFVGQGQPWQAAPRPESPFYHEQLASQYLAYDVGLANEHLDRAGYTERDAEGFRLGPDGKRISFTVDAVSSDTNQVDALELVQRYSREVGIDMQVRALEKTLFQTRREAQEYDANVVAGVGGLQDALLEPRWYLPYSDESNFALGWAAWLNPGALPDNVVAQEPPPAAKEQMALYRQVIASSDPERQAELMKEVLDIAAEQFYAIGINLPQPDFGIVKNNFRNVPETMPGAWAYPNPAPTNPEQYFKSSLTTGN